MAWLGRRKTLRDSVIRSMSADRWLYYLNERLEQDRLVLSKLISETTAQRWIELFADVGVEAAQVSAKGVRELISATKAGSLQRVTMQGRKLFSTSVGV